MKFLRMWLLGERPSNKRLGSSPEIQVDLENFYNIYYSGKIYMGSNREQLNMLYDTGSDWLLCEVHTCETCDDTVYNYADETATSFSVVAPEERDTIVYGSQTSVEGFAVRDTVCLLD